MKKITVTLVLSFICLLMAFGQQGSKTDCNYRYSFSTPYLTFLNFGEEKTNTHHYEFHLGYQLTPKDRIGIKAASWQLFAPMGIQLWDPEFRDESEFFPGKLKERGIGITYQRLLWKGLFASLEVLPLMKTYVNEDGFNKGDGFKLYTTWHLGYQLSFFHNRFYLEPQVHCNYWPVDTKAPSGFEENKWDNYFLFEPNLYIGVKF